MIEPEELFTEQDAYQHSKLCKSLSDANRWTNVANYVLRQTGDKVTAARKANFDLAKRKRRVYREPTEQARLRHYGQRQGWLKL